MTFARESGIRLQSKFLGLMALICIGRGSAITPFSFHVMGNDPGSWPAVLSSIGMISGSEESARVVVVPSSVTASAEWLARIDRGTLLILEGPSELCLRRIFGFRPKATRITSRSGRSKTLRSPGLQIIWEKPLDLPVFEIPADARVFAREKHQRAPLLAGFRRGSGGVLWLAAAPGQRGYERFPYVLQALCDLGFEPPFRSNRLWAFFDSAYRSRADLEYLRSALA